MGSKPKRPAPPPPPPPPPEPPPPPRVSQSEAYNTTRGVYQEFYGRDPNDAELERDAAGLVGGQKIAEYRSSIGDTPEAVAYSKMSTSERNARNNKTAVASLPPLGEGEARAAVRGTYRDIFGEEIDDAKLSNDSQSLIKGDYTIDGYKKSLLNTKEAIDAQNKLAEEKRTAEEAARKKAADEEAARQKKIKEDAAYESSKVTRRRTILNLGGPAGLLDEVPTQKKTLLGE